MTRRRTALHDESVTKRTRDEADPFVQVIEASFSRNKHFSWYEHQPGAVHQFRRIVHGLVADLELAGDGARIQVTRDAQTRRYRLSLVVPRYRVHHQCWLEPAELAALQQHPTIGGRLVFTDDAS